MVRVDQISRKIGQGRRGLRLSCGRERKEGSCVHTVKKNGDQEGRGCWVKGKNGYW